METMINNKQREFLEQAQKRDLLSQAYLFVGPEDVGKFGLAVEFVGLINGIKDLEKIFLGQDPDVFLVEPIIEQKNGKIRKKDISIEQFKEVTGKLGYYAYQSKFKILIVKEAQRMTQASSNSLLKLIEEPPKDLIVILVSDNEQQMLSTIKSRCQIIRFGLSGGKQIQKHLEEKFPNVERQFLAECVELSGGKVKLAENFASDKELFNETRQIRESFRGALKSGVLGGFDLSEEYSSDREKALKAMTYWIQYLREFLCKQIESGADRNISKKVFLMLGELVNLRSQIQNTAVNQRVQLENFFVKIA